MGAATAVFDLVNLLAWRKLPAHRSQDLVHVFTAMDRGFVGPYYLSSHRDYLDYRDANRSFSGLAAHQDLDLRLDTGDTTEFAGATAVSGNFFEVVGLRVTHGRPLNAADARPGNPPVTVISHRLWQRLGGAPEILGRTLKVEGQDLTVVGVGPSDYTSAFAGKVTDLFFPAAALPQILGVGRAEDLEDRNVRRFYMIGRLASGVSRDQAKAEMDTIAARIDADHPMPGDSTRKITATPATVTHPVDLERMRPSLRIFAIAVGLLLVITCANVAHLLLARSAARQREMGIRQSIGASRWRLIRQLLTESSLLALGGGLFGLVLAYWSRSFLLAFTGPEFAAEMRFDYRVLGASFTVCFIATLLFGLAPALATSRVDLVKALKEGTDSNRLRRISAGHLLSVAQVALCVVLLAAGTLLARSLWLRLHADLGFEDEPLFLANLSLPENEYSPDESHAFFTRLKQRATNLPGVDKAAISFLVPPILFDISVPLRLPEDPETTYTSRINIVDGNYFDTLGIPLEQGRWFDERDVGSGQSVVVITRKLAEQLWPRENPLGKTIRTDSRRQDDFGPDWTVIGVASNVTQHRSGLDGEPIIYFSADQRRRSRFYLVLRTTVAATTVSESLRGLLREMDPSIAPLALRSGKANRQEAFTLERMQTLAVGVFAILGLLLAVLGIFGVLSYAVSRRVREVGIRMALGARRGDVLRQILGYGITIAGVGVGLGLLATLWSSRLLENLLFGVAPHDIRVLGAVAAVIIAATLLASYLPARRAAGLDPLTALRHE